jgi:hypothetical protein
VNVWPAIVSVPDRAAPMFAATLNATVPLPGAGGPDVIAIQPAFDAAVHGQLAALAVTATEPVPPTSESDCAVGAIVKVHGAGAACESVIVCPATVSVPVRAAPVFATTVKLTAPLPAPEVALILIQSAFDEAVHAQTLSVATFAEPVPPASGNDWVGAVTVNAHVACVTVNVCFSTVIVPVRAAPVFGLTAKEIVPLP